MSWLRAVAALACVCVTNGSVAASGSTRALVIGINDGLVNEARLQFAETDAALVAHTLAELGAVSASDLTLLRDAPLDRVRAALDATRRALGPDDRLLFFFSGHGDESGAHVKGSVWPWRELRRGLDGVRARVIVAFVDACQSGALLTPKGFLRGPPLRVTLQSLGGPEGRVMITSSGANEISSESTRLAGSPFAQHLVSGLRGGADWDQNRSITVDELYGYLNARTVASTLQAAAGPQHPARAAMLRGTGELVLVRVPGGPRLVRRRAGRGTCYVLDAREVRVLGELGSEPSASLSMASGRYRVTCVEADGVRGGSVALTRGDVALDSIALEPMPLALSLAKGETALERARLELGGGAAWASERCCGAALAVRYRSPLNGGSWATELGSRVGRDDPALAATVQLGFRLPWWRLLALEVGLQTGAEVLLDGERRGRTALLLGQHAQLNWNRRAPLGFFTRVDVLSALHLNAAEQDSAGHFGVLYTVGLAWSWGSGS